LMSTIVFSRLGRLKTLGRYFASKPRVSRKKRPQPPRSAGLLSRFTFHVSRFRHHVSRITSTIKIQNSKFKNSLIRPMPTLIDPSLRHLPLIQSIENAEKLDAQQNTTFHVSAFMFQAWLSELSLANSAQL